MNPDPITFIGELGYTPREAAFLYAVGMHSGYFLRHQFRSRGAACATLTRMPLRRSLSAMVAMSFSATSTHQTNLSTQKLSLGIFTAHKDRRRCSERKTKSAKWRAPFIPRSPSLQPLGGLDRFPVHVYFVSLLHPDSLRVQSRRCPDAGTSRLLRPLCSPAPSSPQTGSW